MKVSIIIPTYNRPKTLRRAVESALNQTYEDIEVIVVDDYSEEDVEGLIEEMDDERIRFFRNKENRGAPYSRNKGLTKAKGEYLNFLDDDDIIFKEKIEKQIQKFKETNDKHLGVVTCDVKYERPDISMIKKNRKRGWIHEDLLVKYCVYGTETMLIKKGYLDKVGGFDEDLPSNQEYDLQIRLAKHCTFNYVPKVLTKKFESENQISFDFDKKLKGTKALWKKYKQEFKQQSMYLYNYLRFTYLLLKYRIGKYFGRGVYSWFP